MRMITNGNRKLRYFNRFFVLSSRGCSDVNVVNLLRKRMRPELSANHSMELMAKLILSFRST